MSLVSPDPTAASALVARLRSGDIRALARAVSLVEDGTGAELLRACPPAPRALRIGLTGSPGAGKSTLADALVRAIRSRDQRVAVLAVDPSSPYTGGALLGDRIRLQGFAADPGVFFRSMASRGEPGGLAPNIAGILTLLETAGFLSVILETVGVGQAEVAVAALVDVTVLVLTPGMGDDIQSLKAGLMEAASLFVINKADLPGAERLHADLRATQSLAHSDTPPPAILRTVATNGEGIPELLTAIEHTRSQPPAALPTSVSLDHLGIAVRSIADARTFYEALGLHITHEETIPHEQVHTAMLPLGATGGQPTRIELLEPTTGDSTIGRFLARRGEGLHHVALRVPDLDARFAALQAANIRLASDAIRTGAGGHRYFFVHPSSTGGVLLELVGD